MSSAKKTIILRGPVQMDALREALAGWQTLANDGRPIAVTLAETKRSLEQNALMWVILTAWAEQVEWQVNGRACHLEPEDWKDIHTAAFLHETGRISPGLSGGMVLLGCRTRDFSVKDMADFLTYLLAASGERGVVLDPAVVPDPAGYLPKERAS